MTEANVIFWQLWMLTMCLFVSSVKIEKKTVTLDETVTLTCNLTCRGLRTWKWTSSDEPVIKCEGDQCLVGNGFESRVRMLNKSFQGKYSLDLVISPVAFNDQGTYTGTCDDQHCDYRLEVLVPGTVNVFAGDNVTLHCYAATKKLKADETGFVQWKKNGETVLELEKGSLNITPMLKNRASVSVDSLKKGDFSLNIIKIHPSDEGLYQCHYSRDTRDTDKFKGAANSVRLNVQATIIPNGETQSRRVYASLTIIFSFLAFCLGYGVAMCREKHPNCSCSTRPPPHPLPEQGEAADSREATGPDENHAPLHACLSNPVPESNDPQLSIPLMETTTHSSFPWKDC